MSSNKPSLQSTKYLAIMAVFIAMKIALASFYFNVTDNLRIYFTFFIKAIEACIIGPYLALISGTLSDIIGYIIKPTGPFFIGYTISTAVGCLIYALLLYNKEVTILRLALSKLLINLVVNVLMGSLWSYILFSKGYLYYFSKSIVKNTLILPLEIIILVVTFNLILPFLIKKKLVKNQKVPIKLF